MRYNKNLRKNIRLFANVAVLQPSGVIKSWILLFRYCREILIINMRIVSRKKKDKKALKMARELKPKQLSRAKTFSMYVRTFIKKSTN